MNNIYNINDIVYVPSVDYYGKIIDVRVNGANTEYMIVFDDGTWDTFLANQIKEDF